MTDLTLVALGGLLGSSHCVGMCGGFAVSLGAGSTTWRDNLLRQIVYGGGRIFTYTSLGAAAGFGGRKLVLATSLINVQALLAILAGVLLVVQGMRATGVWAWLQKRWRTGERAPTTRLHSAAGGGSALPICLQRGSIGSLLRARGTVGPMLAGVMTGFLPCGLVYAMLALAISSGNLADGALTMACFGSGTIPLMTALGLGTSLVGLATRRRMFQLAAWCVVATGCLSMVRGASAWSTYSPAEAAAAAPSCPLCQTAK